MTFWKNHLIASFYGKTIVWHYIKEALLKFILTFFLVMGNILSKVAMNTYEWTEEDEQEMIMHASEGGKDQVFDPPDPNSIPLFEPPVTSSPLPEEISVDLEENIEEDREEKRGEGGEEKREGGGGGERNRRRRSKSRAISTTTRGRRESP